MIKVNKKIALAFITVLTIGTHYGQSVYTRITQQNLFVDPSFYPPKFGRFGLYHNFYSTRMGGLIDSNRFYISNGQYIINDKRGYQRKLVDTLYGPNNYNSYILTFGDTIASVSGLHYEYFIVYSGFRENTSITYSDSNLNKLNHIELSKKVLRVAIYKYDKYCYNMIAIDTSQIYSYRITSKGIELKDSIPKIKIKGLIPKSEDISWKYNFKFSNSGKVFGIQQRLSNHNTIKDGKQLVDTSIISIYNFDHANCKFENKVNSFGFSIFRYSNDNNIERFHPFDFEFSPNDSIIYISNYSMKLNSALNRYYFNLYVNQYNIDDNSKCNTFLVKKDILNGYFPAYFKEHYLFVSPNGRILLYRYSSNVYRIDNLAPDTITIVYDEISNPNVFGKECKFRKEITHYKYLYTSDDFPYYQMIQFPSENFKKIHPISFKYKVSCKDSSLILTAAGDSFYKFYNWIVDAVKYSGKSIKIPFDKTGTIFVKLRGTLTDGTSIETGDSVTILSEYFRPYASFILNDFKQCQFTEVEFNNISIANSNTKDYPKFHWSFGDGKDTILNWGGNIRHIYVKEGLYRLQLVVDNGYCRDTFNIQRTLEVQPAPRPGIRLLTDTPYCTWHPVRVGRRYADFHDSIRYYLNNQLSNVQGNHEPYVEVRIISTSSIIKQSIYGPNGCVTYDSTVVLANPGVREDSRPEITLVDIIDDDRIEVRWDTIGQKFIKRLYYGVIHSSKGTDSMEIESNTNSRLLDMKTDHGPYRFHIRSTDKCGNLSSASNPVNSVYLDGVQEGNNFIDFTWNRISQSDYGEYRLLKLKPERTVMSGIYDTLCRDEDIIDEYKDAVCYRIVRETDTLFESDAHSNSICFRLLPYLIVPSAFSPNGDNINDLFQIRGYGIRKFHIEIYNRWGELIFESDNPNFIWDGVYKGQKMAEGVFYVKINCLGNGKNLNQNLILHLLN